MNSLDYHNPRLCEIFQKLQYWYSRSGSGFYKFLQPCEHQHYRAGDSWCEELSLSEKTFRKYLKKLCTQHPNRASFHHENDPFDGKPFACYYDRIQKKTFYFGNDEIIKSWSKLFSGKGQGAIKKFTPQVRVDSESLYKDNNKHINNIPPKSPLEEKGEEGSLNDLSKKDLETAETMIRQWNTATKGLLSVPRLTKHFAEKLLEALKTRFEGSLENWRRYCTSIGSSDFLLGKVTTFKAWLIWTLREDVFEKITRGLLGVREKFFLAQRVVSEKVEDWKERILSESRAGEGDSEKSYRLSLLQKLGACSYKSWVHGCQVRAGEQGQYELSHNNRFTQNKARGLAKNNNSN